MTAQPLGDKLVAFNGETGTETEDDHEIQRLAGLTALDYERERDDAAKRLNVRVSALDKQVAAIRTASAPPAHDSDRPSPFLEHVQPSPEYVDGAELLDELRELVTMYVVLPDGAADALALWTLFTYTFKHARTCPLIAFTSPDKRCGKSTALRALIALTHRPLVASNISPAALFRSVDEYHPTLLVDECDTFLADNEELRGILNAGHHRDTATAVRCEGSAHEPRVFDVFSPKALALIGKLPPTLADRSIEIPMRRKTRSEKVARVGRAYERGNTLELRMRCKRWADDNAEMLQHAQPALLPSLNDRAFDNWEPLFAIADLAGTEWSQRARAAAKALQGEEDDESAGIALLEDIRAYFHEEQGRNWVGSSELVAYLVELEERPWPEWRRGLPLSASSVARLLKPFGIRPRQQRAGAKNIRVYDRSAFEESWDRYLPTPAPPVEAATVLQPLNHAGLRTTQPATNTNECSGSNHDATFEDAACSEVAPETEGRRTRNEPRLQ